MASSSTYTLNPGPDQRDVLVLQDQHRSTEIWNSNDPGVLECRKSEGGVMAKNHDLPLSVQRTLRSTGFYGVYRIGSIKLDWAFITALIERWRQETHSFHLPVGEASITVQDVVVLLGLPLIGRAVTIDPCSYANPIALCHRLFGIMPEATSFRGTKLKMKWLSDNFEYLDPSTDDQETISRFTRAWLLQTIGGMILGDKSGGCVKLQWLPLLEDLDTTGHYSWGSATLAVLYREMCRATKANAKQIGGPLILLQLWGWERLSHLRPERVINYDLLDNNDEGAVDRPPLGIRWAVQHLLGNTPIHVLPYYRDQLDRMRPQQMIWEPYNQEILDVLPNYCLSGSHIWLAMVPLVCFSIVEWHLPQRILRQFGIVQYIPDYVDTNVKLHGLDDRGRQNTDWSVEHLPFIQYWDKAIDHIVPHVRSTSGQQCVDEYMPWFRRITRRLIGRSAAELPDYGAEPSAALIEMLCESMARIHNIVGSNIGRTTSTENDSVLQEVYRITQCALQICSRGHYLQNNQPFHSHGTMQNIPMPNPKRVRKERAKASQQSLCCRSRKGM